MIFLNILLKYLFEIENRQNLVWGENIWNL